MVILVCPVCSSDAHFYYKYTDFFGADVDIHKCINCGHGVHNKNYSDKEFNDLYESEYAEEYIDKENEAYQKRLAQYALDIKSFNDFVSLDSVDVLDYGCSSGEYLESMPNNWKKSGFEINSTEIEHVKKMKKNVKIYDELSNIKDKYDLITMRGVIEHIKNHDSLIQFLATHTKDGGYLYITATPDFASVCAILYKNDWNQVFCPEHIHQFSAASLSLLLAKAGFVLKNLSHPYYDTPYAHWRADKKAFIDNFKYIQQGKKTLIMPTHAFPGTMLSAIYEKVQ